MAVPLLFFLPNLGRFAYPVNSQFSDLAISHYPNAIYLRNALETWGQVPWWSKSILSGYPFAANPLSGLWYPPGWLVLVLPLPLAFNVMVLLHLFFGGVGMSLLLEAEGRGRMPAAIGGILFVMMPKLWAHFAVGHITMVYAVCWTPWLLWLQKRWFERKSSRRGVILAVTWGVILLADVRWGAFAGVLWFCYFVREHLYEQSQKQGQYSLRSGVKSFTQFGLQALGGIFLAAPLLLPLLEYSNLSTRVLIQPAENLIFSLPPAQLLGLLVPQMGANAEWVVYAGILPVLMLIRVISDSDMRRSQIFWIGVVGVGLLVSLGSYIPLAGWFAKLPGFSLLRVPPRALFFSSMGLAAITSAGVEALIRRRRMAAKGDRIANLLTMGVVSFLLGLSGAVYAITSEIPSGLVWGGVMALIAVVCLQVVKKNHLGSGWIFWLLIALIWCDLLFVGASYFKFRLPKDVYSEGQSAAKFLVEQPGQFRIYSPSYSIPQHTAARYGLELVDGVDPLQLLVYTRFMDDATGVPRHGYSVTLPPYASGNPEVDNAEYLPEAKQLGLLNVQFVTSAFPLADDGLEPLGKYDSVYVYKNREALPRAWVQSTDSMTDIKILSFPEVSSKGANTMEISADGPGVLIISQVVYPGWLLWLDGERQPSHSAGGLLKAVELPPGMHNVTLEFRPVSVYAGLVLAGIALVVGLVLSRRERPDDET
jgi:hypothetical protein